MTMISGYNDDTTERPMTDKPDDLVTTPPVHKAVLVPMRPPGVLFHDDQVDGPIHDNIFRAIAETEGSLHRVRRETRDRVRNPGWAYKIAMSDDETAADAVKLFGRPEGTETREGRTVDNARIFAVWMNDKKEPTFEPEF